MINYQDVRAIVNIRMEEVYNLTVKSFSSQQKQIHPT